MARFHVDRRRLEPLLDELAGCFVQTRRELQIHRAHVNGLLGVDSAQRSPDRWLGDKEQPASWSVREEMLRLSQLSAGEISLSDLWTAAERWRALRLRNQERTRGQRETASDRESRILELAARVREIHPYSRQHFSTRWLASRISLAMKLPEPTVRWVLRRRHIR